MNTQKAADAVRLKDDAKELIEAYMLKFGGDSTNAVNKLLNDPSLIEYLRNENTEIRTKPNRTCQTAV